jgi:asparagine synthase (glutamine-hydrolysing)
MGVQYGRCNFDGRPVDPEYLAKAARLLAPYGPDGESTYIKDGLGIVFRAFATTQEARREKQPYLLPGGGVLVWDGRVDNRQELVRELGHPQYLTATDLEIAGAAYERWGTDSLGKLIGDWALSIWEPKSRSLLLAKDPIGTHHLYYSIENDQVTWSTILDPLVLLSGKTFALEEEYIAGWLAFFPATHLTPYVGVHAVPPATVVRIMPAARIVHRYWDFDPGKRICYRTDGEYEEHFRQVFEGAVRRRLRSDTPVLAELSGGMDSSSIVCMADAILADTKDDAVCLDTASYYDDSDQNWNERPYFIRVEEQRGRTGFHFDVGRKHSTPLEHQTCDFAANPGACRQVDRAEEQFARCVESHGYRVVLSGIGGDEVTGGVPTPIPELLDQVATLRLRQLVTNLKSWALAKRVPWFYLLWDAVREFLPIRLIAARGAVRPPVWLNPGFLCQHRNALHGYPSRTRLTGVRPSLQHNRATVELLRRQFSCDIQPINPAYDRRYPYLDRDLLEFLFAVPREQLVRPGQRRS